MESKSAGVQARKVDPTEMPPHGGNDAARRNKSLYRVGISQGGVEWKLCSSSLERPTLSDMELIMAVTPRGGSGLPVLWLGMKHQLQYQFLITSREI